jgi:hypothetical protein
MTAKRTGKRRKWPWVVGGLLAALVAFPYVAVLIATGTSGIVHRFEPIRGRVVDDKTGAPLEGAVVVAVYEVTMPSVGGEVDEDVDAAEAVTGPDGRFEIPPRFVFGNLFPGAWFDEVRAFYVIRTGYACRRVWSRLSKLQGPNESVEFRLRNDATTEERKKLLDRPSMLSPIRYQQFFNLYNQERIKLGLRPL